MVKMALDDGIRDDIPEMGNSQPSLLRKQLEGSETIRYWVERLKI